MVLVPFRMGLIGRQIMASRNGGHAEIRRSVFELAAKQVRKALS
jgi:hypothetical protein